MNPHLQRALLLLEQSRHELAEQELRQTLSQYPDDAMAHAVLAICLAHGKKYTEASQEAELAIHLSPEDPFAFYAHSMVLAERNHFPEALAAINEAIGMDPYRPEYFAMLARLHMQQRQWQAAFAAAASGLELDPEDVECTNLRAMALVKLGKQSEAGESIGTALKRDPEDAFSHANMGWSLIEQGDYRKAMEHFREALRLNPELEWARQGIVEALKARNPLYRIMLRYFLWMMKLSGQARWGVILGGYIAYRVLRSIAHNNPDLAPWLMPLIITYVTFVIMTWVAYPLFNLMLRLHPMGRFALSREQTVTANWVGLCFLGAVAFLTLNFATGIEGTIAAALVCGLMIPSVATIYACDKGWPRNTMLAIAIGLAALGGSYMVFMFGSKAVDGFFSEVMFTLGGLSLLAFIIGAVASQFAANALVSVTPRR